MKNTRPNVYLNVKGLSLGKRRKENITVSALRAVVTATAATAPKCFTSMV